VAQPRKQYPSPRRWLLKLHEDLLTVHSAIDPWAAEYPTCLSEFERLVLTLEDRRFFQHMGIDWRRFIRDAFRAITFRTHGGASTIDMQFVRTATGYRDRKIRRKLYEGLLAYIIQHRYSKLEILRSYLRIAYFGTGLKGGEAAAREVYGRSTTQLDVDQAASVAAMLVFPRPRNPNEAWNYKHLRRANYIKAVYTRRKQGFDKLEKRIFS